jgi:hypothetical protein
MGNRIEQLRTWGVSATLLRMAGGDFPHPAFEARCEQLGIDDRRRTWGLNLDQAEVRDETGGLESAALWEHDVGDGHAFEVVYGAFGERGVEFWHVMYADDTGGPDGKLVARSEQGLFYWLFFSLIGTEFFALGERAYASLAAAAKAVSFDHLVEVFRLEEEIGSDYDRRGELLARSLAIE